MRSSLWVWRPPLLASFAERFGAGTEEAVKAFMDEIRKLMPPG